jgi:hypothetical protein
VAYSSGNNGLYVVQLPRIIFRMLYTCEIIE